MKTKEQQNHTSNKKRGLDMRVRDIIKPQMTTLRFMYFRGLDEAYFQNVCRKASHLAFYGDSVRHHPYSFAEMKSFWDSVSERVLKRQNS